MRRARGPCAFLLCCLLAGPAPPAAAAEPVSVAARPFAELAFYPHYETPAEVEALRHTRVSSRMEATVEEVGAAVGDEVEAGQTLVELDCRVPRARMDASRGRAAALQARLERARLGIRRLESLSRQEHASRERLDDESALALELEATLQAEQAEGRALAAQVRDCRITAPFAGTITRRSVSIGHLATPGEMLYTLLDPGSLEVVAGVPEQRVPGFLTAREYRFLGADGAETRLGLKAAPPWIDPVQRTRPVRLRAADGAPLIAGRSGRLRWALSKPHLPGRLLVHTGEEYGVFVAHEGRTARFIAVADAQEGRAFALDLDADVLLVTAGRHGLADGQPLRIRSPAAAR